MAGLDWQELLLIVVIVLLLFGVGKLPTLSGQLGRGMRSRLGAPADRIEGEHERSDAAEVDN